MSETPVFRFAPSPNGQLHLGHAYSAIFTHDAARKAGGRFLLRIEDIDIARCRPEYEQQIYDDLGWLGLSWEEPVRRQSEHMDDYRAAISQLEKMGLLYPCFSTRSEIRAEIEQNRRHPKDPDGAPVYPGIWRGASADLVAERKAKGEAFNMRLDMAKAIRLARIQTGEYISFIEDGPLGGGELDRNELSPEIWGDVVIARKDVPTSYHLSVVIDDAIQKITNVTRGHDLYFSTPVHRLLQILLDLPEPHYLHHRLVRDEKGRRLSKSAQGRSIASLRKEGGTPESIRKSLKLI